MDLLGLAVVVIAAALLLALIVLGRRLSLKLRPIAALTRLYRAVGLSVEDGTRMLVGLGSTSLLTRSGGAALAGLGLLRAIAERTSVSDQPPLGVAGEPALSLLAQDTLLAGYQAAGAAEYYQPTGGRLTGMTPFSSVAGTMPLFEDEQVSAAALAGHYGIEAGLLSEAAERANTLLIGASDDPTSQAVLYATANEALIGEELFSAPAYLGASRAHAASLTVQDVLRWLVILALLGGAALKFVGLI